MSRLIRDCGLALVFTLALGVLPVLAQDGEPAKDHPSVPRFPGMAMSRATETEFYNGFYFQIGPGDKTRRVEGKSWEFEYTLKEGARHPSPLDIARHYATQFTTRGGKVLYQTDDATEATMMMPLGGGERWLHLKTSGDAIAMVIIEQAPQKVYLTDHSGVWRSNYDVVPVPRLSALELATLRGTLNRIEDVVHATPMLNPPRGVDIRAGKRLDLGCPSHPRLCRQTSLAGWMKFEFEQYSSLDGKVATQTSEPPHMDVAFNDPTATYILHHAGGLVDESGSEIVGPLIELERVGHVAVYDNGVVILGRNPRPFFVPASREQYLRAVMAQVGSTLSDDGAKVVLEGLRGELAALSPEQRRSQAYTNVNSRAGSLLVAADDGTDSRPSDERAIPLFIFNPAYFDPALPRTAVQLITMRYVDLEGTGQRLHDRPDLLERSPITPERLAFLIASGVSVAEYRIFELARLLNYSALTALLAAPTPRN